MPLVCSLVGAFGLVCGVASSTTYEMDALGSSRCHPVRSGLCRLIQHAHSHRARQQREAGYQSILRSYNERFKPGVTRKEVEKYLHAESIPFRQMCCVEIVVPSKDVYDDLTKIGQEEKPWFCSENNVYIAFQFVGVEPRRAEWSAESRTN